MTVISRARRTVALLASASVASVLVVGLGATLGPTSSAAEAQPSSTSVAPVAGDGTTVTLITGDVVDVYGAGTPDEQVVVRAQPGATGRSYSRFTDDTGDWHVVPSDVEALVGGQLDPDLFNVSLLVRDGYDDARSPALPMIVQYTGAPVALPGTEVVRLLDSIEAAAVTVDRRAGATELGVALGRAADARSLAGVTKIWLDGRVHAALDESVPQVGAPAAWAAGWTGQGLRIGIVDTGVDGEHPDLDGRLVAAETFTTEGTGDVSDATGHGTHVASIAAGDGAASDGRYTGVAYDAELVSARVLNEFGEGNDSWVIAGLEWAAEDQDADVINVSLNSGPSDGTDPVSQAIDTLSEQTGALVVVSAGNDGYGVPGSVYAPATADAALAVGAVTKQDQLADFTGIGPRLGRFGVKPELVAPGVDITAAQASTAQIGEPVGDDYLILSGTSMAAPHVTGAAALLLQAEPTLDWQQLRARLVTSAVDLGFRTFEQGGGRLDVAAALDQEVSSDLATINLGTLTYPHDDGETSTREVTLTNHGETAVNLDLAATAEGWAGDPAPDGMLTTTPSEATVPAGGSVTVSATFDASYGEIGTYGGALVASSAGVDLLRIPLGFEKEQEKYDLRIEVLGPDGTTHFDGNLTLLSLESEVLYERVPVGDNGVDAVEYRLPAEHYSAVLQLFQDGPDGPAVYDVSLPELELDQDRTIVLDAADTVEITAEITDDVTPVDAGMAFTRSSATDVGIFSTHDVIGVPGIRAFARPTGPVTLGEYFFTSYQNFAGDGISYHLVHPEHGEIPADLSYPAGPDDLARVDHEIHADAEGRQLLMAMFGGTDEFVNEASSFPVAGGAVHTTWVTGDIVTWRESVAAGTDPAMGELSGLDLVYETGSTTTHTWFAQPVRPGGRDGSPPASRFGNSMYFELYPFIDPAHHIGFLDPGLEGPSVDEAHFTLALDGEVILEGDDLGELGVEGGLPPREARYDLTLDVARDAPWWQLATQTSTTWSFVSRGGDESYPTMLQVDYGVPVDLLNRVEADAIPITFDVYVPGRDVPAPPADLASFQAWWSSDDGATWSEISLEEAGTGAYEGVLDEPCSDCTPMLRIAAEDTEGAMLDQTIDRAFHVVDSAAPPPTTPTPTSSTTLPGTGGGNVSWLAALGLGAVLLGGLVVAISARRLRTTG